MECFWLFAFRHSLFAFCNWLYAGTSELWSLETLKLWNIGTLEGWNSGTVEQWNIGTLKFLKVYSVVFLYFPCAIRCSPFTSGFLPFALCGAWVTGMSAIQTTNTTCRKLITDPHYKIVTQCFTMYHTVFHRKMKHPCIAKTYTYEQNSKNGGSPALAGQAIRNLKISFVRMKRSILH